MAAQVTHDPLCVSQEFLPADLTRFCDCERVARIRADERGKVVAEYATWGPTVLRPEVSTQADVLEAERDAARAEVAALRDELRAEDTERDMRLSAEAEVAALRERYPSTIAGMRMHKADERRDVLADLRAKAEGLPVRLTDDGVGTSLYVYVKRADVLALLDEDMP